MGTERGTSNRGTAAQGIRRPPNLRIQEGRLRNSWALASDRWVFDFEIAALLFRSGTLPPGFRLESRSGGNPDLRWTLSWSAGSMSPHGDELSDRGKTLRNRVILGGDEFDEDTSEREGLVELQRLHNRQHVPALNMTGEEAMRTLKPGLYVAAPSLGIRAVPPVAPEQRYADLQVDWIKPFSNGGIFAWLGTSAEGTTLEVFRVGTSFEGQLWRDVVWFVQHEKDSLFRAVDKFCKRWDELNRMMMFAFALALTDAPSIGPKGNLVDTGANAPSSARRGNMDEPQIGPAIRDGDRGLAPNSRVKMEMKPTKLLSHVDPLDAAQAAVMVAAKLPEDVKAVSDFLDEALDEEETEELLAVSKSIRSTLTPALKSLPKRKFDQTKTGDAGEAGVTKVLQKRGYWTFSIQNASGHGIDIIAVKVKNGSIVQRKDGQISIITVEVKSSEEDHRGSLSHAQKNNLHFVLSRLELCANRKGQWQNVSVEYAKVAKLLHQYIVTGNPIAGIRATVKYAKSGIGSMMISFAFWKVRRAQLPTAKLLKPKAKKK